MHSHRPFYFLLYFIFLCHNSISAPYDNTLNEFKNYKNTLAMELSEYQKISQEETLSYQEQILETWDSAEISNRTVWIEYSKDFNQKNKIDFKKGIISITRIQDDNRSKETLKSVLTQVLLKNKKQAFNDDQLAQAIEKRSQQTIKRLKKASVKPEGILIPLITGKNAVSSSELNTIIDSMLKEKRLYATVNRQGKRLITLEVPLYSNQEAPSDQEPSHDIAGIMDEKSNQEAIKRIKNAENALKAESPFNKFPLKAQNIKPFIEHESKEHHIPPEVILAIIEAESSFNPLARSGVPAYGLMQIVPVSAGQDATKKLFGEAKILAPSYLYNSENNIEIGSAYLNILYYNYLKAVDDPLSRLYCTIAAYNTGAGNVAKAFTSTRKIGPAAIKINQMKPQSVYEHLLLKLPYEETRHYLKKVNHLVNQYRT